MSNIIEKIEQNITSRNLFDKKKQVLLAFSGGRDSVSLLYALNKLGIDISLIHVNYCLRNNESDKDQSFTEDLAIKLNIPYFVKKIPLKKYLNHSPDSLQMLARKMRYAFFYEILNSQNFSVIATAHHANDNLETSLLNFTKAKGLGSIAGIPWKNDKIVRPMLNITREEIDQFIKTEKLPFREDSSNEHLSYQRNYIRHEIIPLLKKINPGLENSHINLAGFLSQNKKFVDQSMEEIKFQISQKIDTQTTYSFGNLLQNTNLSFIIFSLFQKYGLGRAQASDLHNCLLNNHVGAEFYTKNYLLIVGRNYTIFLSKLEEKPARQYLLYEGGQILFGRIKISISKKQKRPKTLKQRGSNTLYVNSRINFPLIVRHWEHGDRIQPLGMHGTKLLSDVFIDNKMDFFEKSNLPILICQSEIVCAGKYQLSEKFSVQPKDDSCFAINFADE